MERYQLTGRAGARLGYFVLVSFVLGCRSEKAAPPSTVSSSHVQNPKAYPRERLTQALESVQSRWQSVGALPKCETQLTKQADRERCAVAEKARSERIEAIARGVSDHERIELAGRAALNAQRASGVLRDAGVTRLLESRPQASARATPTPPESRAKPKPQASALKSVPPREQSDPYLDAIQAYTRVVSIALAELRAYLEFGDVTLRAAALSEVERLTREQAQWAALRGLVNEAHLVEADPALKARLRALQNALGAP